MESMRVDPLAGVVVTTQSSETVSCQKYGMVAVECSTQNIFVIDEVFGLNKRSSNRLTSAPSCVWFFCDMDSHPELPPHTHIFFPQNKPPNFCQSPIQSPVLPGCSASLLFLALLLFSTGSINMGAGKCALWGWDSSNLPNPPLIIDLFRVMAFVLAL